MKHAKPPWFAGTDKRVTCWGCEQFKAGSRGSYSADCKDCAARSLAQSPEHFEAAQAGAMTPRYRAALQRASAAIGSRGTSGSRNGPRD